MEEKGKQDSTANMMNVNENCMDIEIICRQEENVGDQLPYADEELITHFLDKKMIDQRFLDHTVHDVDFFLYHPQQLSLPDEILIHTMNSHLTNLSNFSY
ncbi:hypothetical protein T459_14654 [Capsicum annuum]|uniref:NAC domain-containing protein n=1 Tax=Capsicum annuum TaxID=4072 RepID=A0A2G2ZI10_CAPAN|nr:hypothetical protein T459_14654 [Capsicum annuum]